MADHPLFVRGLQEFRGGRFFEAHEEWERLWKTATGNDRLFLQGLIQLAAGLVHTERGRTAPATRLFRLSRQKLAPYPDGYAGLPLGRVRSALDQRLDEKGSGDALSLARVFGIPQSNEGA
jgi:predicted metal-dependent hydrolase